VQVEQIKHWLNSHQDYDAGVQLYLQHGKDSILRSLFTREEQTPFKKQRLLKALRDLYEAEKHPASEKKQAQLTVTQTAIPQYKHWPAHPMTDAVLLALWNQWKPLYGEMMDLQHRVYEVAFQGQTDTNKKMEAGQMALRILELDDQVEFIYAQRNFYYQHNRLPEERKQEEEVIVDPVKWAIELKNNERYVRDYKLKLAKDPHNKLAPKWAMTLKEKQAEVAKYKKLLKLDDGTGKEQ
jgi:hypothetical protein